MRIAVVIEDPPPLADRAGAVRLYRLAREFADRGHDATVYCTGWWTHDRRRIDDDGVTFEAVTVAPARTSFLARLPALLARDRPDAVVVSPSPPGAAVAASVGGSLARAPVVCDWVGDEPGPDDPRRLAPAARAPGVVVTPSELQRTRVRELGVDEADTRVIPQSIDFSRVAETPPRGRDGPEAVYARRLDAAANLESFLLALAELRKRDDWTATVVGDGPARADYEQQADDLGIGDRVAFVGDVDREARIAAYRAADAFVQTAVREQFAEELLWALAAGCVGVVEYQADSSAHELLAGHDRGIRVTESEALDDAIEDAWTFVHRDLAESYCEYDHAAVAGDYVELFRDCGVDAR
ncbi:glycosyl transferase family 1 [Halobacteriales archaeon SW_12_69_24]|nr:MAG: glycosyl transferase family 1 [Halobacteriales archaeon SW_12_69_24]